MEDFDHSDKHPTGAKAMEISRQDKDTLIFAVKQLLVDIEESPMIAEFTDLAQFAMGHMKDDAAELLQMLQGPFSALTDGHVVVCQLALDMLKASCREWLANPENAEEELTQFIEVQKLQASAETVLQKLGAVAGSITRPTPMDQIDRSKFIKDFKKQP